MSRHQPRVVALGGGHGLSATLGALRRLTPHLTAVVTVADDGGSSGRLRGDMPWLLPPGDLRMAVCALAAEDPVSQAWAALLQQRFAGGALDGHPVGNLLLAGLLQQEAETGPEAALRRLCKLVGAVGTVLPLSTSPVDIEADVAGPDGGPQGDARQVDARSGEIGFGESRVVRGQVAVATTQGTVLRVRLSPATPPVSPELVAALEAADCVILGPGSLFTSQLPHLLTPQVATVLQRGVRLVHVLNLVPQPGETDGLDAAGHVHALMAQTPWLRPAVIVADEAAVPTGSAARRRLLATVAEVGAALLTAPLEADDKPGVHDAGRLAVALDQVLSPQGGSVRTPGVNLESRVRQDGATAVGSIDLAGAKRGDVDGVRAWWQ